VDIDISSLTIGGALHVSDIVIPPGVELETDLAATVVAGNPPRVQAATEVAEEAEGEEAAPAAESTEG
jgi:hypothetical protein